jgi:predicted DNA-binding protein
MFVMTAASKLTVRVPAEDFDRLTAVARRLSVGRSSLIRRALERGLRAVQIEEALARYQEGEANAAAAAQAAGLSLWEFLDVLSARGVPFKIDEDPLREQLAEFRERLDQQGPHSGRRHQ